MLKRVLTSLTIGLLLTLNFNLAQADDMPNIPIPGLTGGSEIFIATISVLNAGQGGNRTTKTFRANGSVTDIIDKFKDADLASEFTGGSGFNADTSSISGTLSLRGVLVTAQVSTTGGVRTLNFCLSSSCQTFKQSVGSSVSGTAKAAGDLSATNVWDQLIDYLKGIGGTSVLNNLADDWVKQTSIDPVAGNPSSFMAQLTKANFNLAATGILNGDTSGLDLFSTAPGYSQNSTNGYSVKSAYLPLKYSHYFNSDNAMFVDMPISYDQVEQAQAYSLALGLGYTHVFIRTPNVVWSLTPSVYAGAVGSIDLGSGTLLYDGALASRVVIPHGAFTYGITDDISYLKTAKVKIGDVETPYDMNNVLTSNGFDVTYHLHKNYTVGGFYTLTNALSGIDWYVSNYSEIGFKLAKLTDYKSAMYDHMTLSVGYLFGKNDYQGGSVTLGFNL